MIDEDGFDAPPNDAIAERNVIGSALQNPRVLAECRELLHDDGSDFYRPAAAAAWVLLCGLADREQPTETGTVLAAAQSDDQTRRLVTTDMLMAALEGATPASGSWFAQRVAFLAGLRRLSIAGHRIARIANQSTGQIEAEEGLDAVVTRAEEELAKVGTAKFGVLRPVNGLTTIAEFTDQLDDTSAWLVPDLIDAQDVFMLLASEGAGKTVLSRQMVISLAAGVHPFRPKLRVNPCRTLLVDLENPVGLARRNMRDGRHRLEQISGDALGDRAWVWMKPEGLNLRNGTDAALLERVIETTRPQLVAFGSLYKAFLRAGDDWETAADEVRAVFDRLRARYGIALWLEHHMPKGNDPDNRPKMPYGSSVWQRWASHGRVLEQTGLNNFELDPSFRGDREPRPGIPLGLYRNTEEDGPHWLAIWDEGVLDAGRWPSDQDRRNAR